ncbi:hypothetical protein Micbo1qcDRAFT_173460 [Microdochium bolleyi]|uniref:DUF155 domain-containing protein n=1 Tax=Microdochium bolleyi TaxID=196109 RepID=A0A136JC17_9PEZI|nr:hypothetical protein Micbo1qcDRAFT_173460 [Microdochium bolleyi]
MMPTQTSERSPLLRQDTARPKAPRNVTFNANPVSRTISPAPVSLSSSPTPNPRDLVLNRTRSTGGIPTAGAAATSSGTPPMLSALNSRLRRRNSHGSAAGFTTLPPSIGPIPKIGPQRSSKTAQKLKLLPAPDEDGEFDEESGRDVYSQFTRIKDPTARRDAARLGKADRERLPRVTAYCTANKYKIEDLIRFLKGKSKTRGANAKLIDECIYTPYNYNGKTAERQQNSHHNVEQQVHHSHERRHSTGQFEEASEAQRRENDLIDLREEHKQQEQDAMETTASAVEDQPHSYSNGRDVNNDLAYPTHHHDQNSLGNEHLNDHRQQDPDFDTQVHTPEVFIFDYGVVVIWGMTLAHEQRFLKDIAKFELDKLEADDVETECFNFYYTREYQPRIYNDFITLRDKGNYMTKLAISHALAQSVKTSLFEEMIASTVDECKDIPTQIAMTGKIALSRKEINMQIGELFILRINIHLNGSVLDTPELFWVEPHLEPVYQAVRSYLEMDQRVGLLTERLDVIADLLAVLKDQLSHGHGEMLEWIVIILIAAEILVAAINIVVDLYAGVD